MKLIPISICILALVSCNEAIYSGRTSKSNKEASASGSPPPKTTPGGTTTVPPATIGGGSGQINGADGQIGGGSSQAGEDAVAIDGDVWVDGHWKFCLNVKTGLIQADPLQPSKFVGYVAYRYSVKLRSGALESDAVPVNFITSHFEKALKGKYDKLQSAPIQISAPRRCNHTPDIPQDGSPSIITPSVAGDFQCWQVKDDASSQSASMCFHFSAPAL